MRVLLVCVFLLVGLNVPAAEVEQLGQKLITLRAEVDRMQADLDQKRQEHKARMASLLAQAGDLENRNRRQDSEIQRLEKEIGQLQTRMDKSGMDAQALEPVVLEALQQSRQRIRAGLPFKQQERLQSLDEIEHKLNAQALDAWSALQRLWAFQEDEMRLLHENALHSQTIDLNGEQVLVDVARLGGVMLFFRTEDQRFGYAEPSSNGAWRFVLLNDATSREQVAQLFDSLQKQIRQGLFPLPAAAIPLTQTQRAQP